MNSTTQKNNMTAKPLKIISCRVKSTSATYKQSHHSLLLPDINRQPAPADSTHIHHLLKSGNQQHCLRVRPSSHVKENVNWNWCRILKIPHSNSFQCIKCLRALNTLINYNQCLEYKSTRTGNRGDDLHLFLLFCQLKRGRA